MTKQRRIILEVVCGRTDHPTVEDVFVEVRKRLPRISLATVYRSLEALASTKMIQRLEMPGRRRYDGTAQVHYHVHCIRCGRVDDLGVGPSDQIRRVLAERSDYQILGHNLEVTGICPECQKSQIEREC